MSMVKKYYPSKKSLTLLKVIFLLFTILFSFLAKVYLDAYPILMYLTIILFCGLFVLFASVWLPIYFSKTIYYVSQNEISKQSGVIFENKQLMKVSSIQYVTRLLTPLSKYTGFNFIKMNALGGSLSLYFLSREDANEITATISAAIRQRQE